MLTKMLRFAGVNATIGDAARARVDPSVAYRREKDPRIAEIRERALLERFGYS